MLNSLTIPEVANYAEQITSSTIEAGEKLNPVKAFLTYTHKQGLTAAKLSVHIKVKKSASKTAQSSKESDQKTVLLTAQGYTDLETKLTALKNERPHIADELRKAAADKDFRENAPLEAVREQQGHLEAQIRELESTLNMATIIDEKQAADYRVTIGDTVALRDLSSGERMEYTLVDSSEAKPIEGKISITSPIGKALLGHKKADRVEVNAPAGISTYEIEDIKQH